MDCDYCKNEITPAKVRKSTGGNFDVTKDTITMPFKCKYCGGHFCAKHRLPENHDCPGLKTEMKPLITMDFDIELENIIESGHNENNEKIESHIQSKISQNQALEYINCDVCGRKKKIHKRPIAKTIGTNVNFLHSNPENIQYTCIYCGNNYCYDHIQPGNHNCSYSIWNPEEAKRKRKLHQIKWVIVLTVLLFTIIYFYYKLSI